MTKPPELTLSDQLKFLVKYCEKSCVADCCGIDAFDFSPLHVASYISAYTGRISPSDIAEWEELLTKAETSAVGMTPNEAGFICSIGGMNQYFTRESFNLLFSQLRHSIRASPQVLELSERLRYPRT